MQATLERPHPAFSRPEEQLRPWLDARRTLKLRQHRSASWPTLVVFILVLTIGLATAWWLSPRIDLNLPEVSELANATGFVRSGAAHPMVGYVRDLTDNERSGASCESTDCTISR